MRPFQEIAADGRNRYVLLTHWEMEGTRVVVPLALETWYSREALIEQMREFYEAAPAAGTLGPAQFAHIASCKAHWGNHNLTLSLAGTDIHLSLVDLEAERLTEQVVEVENPYHGKVPVQVREYSFSPPAILTIDEWFARCGNRGENG